jgi:hypothetical protein
MTTAMACKGSLAEGHHQIPGASPVLDQIVGACGHQQTPHANNGQQEHKSSSASIRTTSALCRLRPTRTGTMPVLVWCVFVLLFVLECISSLPLAESATFGRVCALNETVVLLEYNSNSTHKDYYTVSNTSAMDALLLFANGSTPTLASLAEQNLFPARQCPCVDDGEPAVYCTLDSGDVCGMRRDPSPDGSNTGEVSCFLLSSRTVFVRNAWPVVVLWYGGE